MLRSHTTHWYTLHKKTLHYMYLAICSTQFADLGICAIFGSHYAILGIRTCNPRIEHLNPSTLDCIVQFIDHTNS